MIKLTCNIFISYNDFFIFVMYVWKCLKVYHLNIFKIIKKEYKRTCKKYQTLSKEGKKKRGYGCEWYKKLPEDKKQTLVEYRKKKL